MYENEIADAAAKLAFRVPTSPAKLDRTYTTRMAELLQVLESQCGCAQWATLSIPGAGQTSVDPAVQLAGVELSTQEPVVLRVYNAKGKRVPKNITFSLIRQSNGHGLAVGVHCGTLRMTTLRTKSSYYDGGPWTLQHFRAQLAVEQIRGKLSIPPEVVEAHLQRAAKKLEELGITNTKHVILPLADNKELRDIEMVPYLVGDYGAMPVAVKLSYLNSVALTMKFYIIGSTGLTTIDFGYLDLRSDGTEDDSMMDIGKLLAGPTK